MSDSSSSSSESHTDTDEDVGGWEEEAEGGPRPEKILKKRRNKKGKEEFLVKWKDCGDEDNSWVTYDTVKKYPKLRKDFERINLGKRELVAREEGRKKRMEGGSGSQGMTVPPPDSGGSGAAQGHGEASESSKKRSKTSSMAGVPGSSPPTSTSAMEQCLQNPLILANLFKVCPHDLLVNCRLVSKTWYRESLVTWRSTSSLIVLDREEMDEKIYLAKRKDLSWKEVFYDTPLDIDERDYGDSEDEDRDFRRPSRTSLPTFLKYLRQECGSKPYRQFHLCNWSFTHPPTCRKSSRDIKTIQGQQDRFWELVGVHVTFLKLSRCTFQDASVFRKIIFQTCPNLQTLILYNCKSLKPLVKPKNLTVTQYLAPAYGEQINLKSLSVHMEVDEDREETEMLPVSPLELLSHFPSLTSLNLMYDESFEHDEADMCDLIAWINAIKAIRRHDGDKLPLGNFRVAPGVHLEHSIDPAKCRELHSLFLEMNLHPEVLNVDLHCDVVGVLKDVLTFPFRKIRALEDGGTGGCCGRRATPSSKVFPCKFPFGLELDHLKELTLSAGFCRDMEFMKWTPNLEKLQILENDREWGHHGGGAPDQMVLNSSEASMGGVKLLKLKELWMGYVPHDVEGVRRLCGWMPNLEVATMFLDDRQFSVICENWSKLMHLHVLGSLLGDKGITGMGFESDDDGDGSDVAVARPNITLLKELTCFQFASLESKLSDSAIYNGFLQLPKLQTLEIASINSTIGDEALTAIHEKVPNCQVIGSPTMKGPIRKGGPPIIRQRKIRCRYFR